MVFQTGRDGRQSIYTMNLDGTEQRKVIGSLGDNTSPRWSPDGQFIAFVSTRDSDTEVYVARADGSEPRRLTALLGPDTSPAWSPDGSRIAFVSTVNFRSPGETTDVLVINIASGEISRVTSSPEQDASPVWAPDGRITWQTTSPQGSAILFSRLDGSPVGTLVDTPGADSGQAFAPDGSRMAFVSDGDVFVALPDGSGASVVARNPATDASPAWSADSRRIAFSSDRTGSLEIHLVNPDGSGLTQLTSSSDTSDSSPVWRPGAPQ
jgi:TolB protein